MLERQVIPQADLYSWYWAGTWWGWGGVGSGYPALVLATVPLCPIYGRAYKAKNITFPRTSYAGGKDQGPFLFLNAVDSCYSFGFCYLPDRPSFYHGMRLQNKRLTALCLPSCMMLLQKQTVQLLKKSWKNNAWPQRKMRLSLSMHVSITDVFFWPLSGEAGGLSRRNWVT